MRNLVRSVCCAAVLASPAAMAGVTGNAGAVTEYLYRGIEQSNGAAVQGGVDWTGATGAYAGTWVSTTGFTDANGAPVSYETDFYGGYTFKVGGVGLDAGLLYYYYREQTDFNTLEAYIGATIGPVTGKVYYTPEYFGAVDAAGDDLGGLYATISGAFPLSDSLTLTPQFGVNTGDGVDAVFGEEFFDYSVTLAKTLDAGMTFSFALVGTDIEDDDQKLVIGLKKSFDL